MSAEISQIFKVLADPTRLRIFRLLLGGEYCNCELNQETGLSINLLSHHLKVLQDAGLITARHDEKDSRWVHYSIDPKRFHEVHDEINALFNALEEQPRKSNCPPK